MNRFDKSFNNVDTVTGRPFSSGHPDGVWVIGIVYVLILAAAAGAAVVGILTSVFAKQPYSPRTLAPLLVMSFLYLPAIILLAMRSASAVIWMVGLAFFFALGAVAAGILLSKSGQLSGATVAGMLFAVVAQAYAAYYTYGLKREALLLHPAQPRP
jgi:hypothetical protein